MAFDLANARPVTAQLPAGAPPPAMLLPPARGGFDLANARPVGVQTSAPPSDLEHFIPSPAPSAPSAPSSAPPAHSFLGDLGHAAGVDTRSAIEGLTSLAALPSDALFGAINLIQHLRGQPMPFTLASQSIDKGLTAAGLPQAENPTERVAGDIVGALTGTGGEIAGASKVAEITASPIVRRIGEALAEHPARQLAGTIGGTAATDAATAAGVPAPLAQLAGVASGVVAGGRAPTEAESAADQLPPSPAQTPVEVARAVGYKLKPTEAGGGAIAKAAEGASGSAKLTTSLADSNQDVTNGLAAQEIGLDPAKPITDQALNKAKQPFNAAHQQAASLGPLQVDQQFRDDIGAIGGDRISTDPAVAQLKSTYSALTGVDAEQLVNEVRGLRRDANQNIRAPYDPERQAKGYAQQQAADAFDDLLERNAIAQGQPQIVDQLKAARVGLAKINTVQQALVGNDVSASTLARMADRGAPLSGRLKIIADVATQFPKVMRDRTALTNRTGFTVPEYALAAMEGPKGAGVVLLRHGARALLKSNLYQNQLGRVAPELGPGSPLGEYFVRPGEPVFAPAPERSPVAALPAPGMLGSERGTVATEQQLHDIGLTPDVAAAGAAHPGSEHLVDVPPPAPPRALPAPGQVPIPMESDELARARLADALGLTPDVVRAGAAHPGVARVATSRAPLALPAPTREPLVVDQAGRVAPSPEELAAHRQALGVDELGPGVRQPAASANPEREAAAANTLQAATTIQPPNAQAASKALRQLAKQVRNNPADDSKIVLQYGSDVHPSVAQAFKQAGVDVAGFSHVIDADHVRHIFLEHGDAATELPRGQLPVTAEDFANLPKVTAAPDSVTPATTGNGRPTVVLQKRIGSDVYVVEEARTGRKQLAVVSMRKVGRRGQMPDLGAPAPDLNVRDVGDTTSAESTTPAAAPRAPQSAQRSASQIVAQRSEPFSAHTVAHTETDTGQHIFRSQNGQLTAQESGPYLMTDRIDVAPEARGKGEGIALTEKAVETAISRGLRYGSDKMVSPDQRKVYRALANRGWTVKQNPATLSEVTKNLVSDDPRLPVYEVSAPKPPSAPAEEPSPRGMDVAAIGTQAGRRWIVTRDGEPVLGAGGKPQWYASEREALAAIPAKGSR